MISQLEQLRHFRSNYLDLIILPTEACNFRCTYCYETFENKKMPRPVVTGIKSLIDHEVRIWMNWKTCVRALQVSISSTWSLCCQQVTRYLRDLPPTGALVFGAVPMG